MTTITITQNAARLKMEVSKQPVAVSINASSDDFLFYSSGAFS
jgi:hypothetical protein